MASTNITDNDLATVTLSTKPRRCGYRCRLSSELKGDRGKLFSADTGSKEKQPIEIEIRRKNEFPPKGFVEVAVVSSSANKPNGAYELANSDTKLAFDVQSDSKSVKFENLRIARMKKGTKSIKRNEEDEGKFRLKFTISFDSFRNSVVPNLILFSEVIYDASYKKYRKPNLVHITPSKCSVSEGAEIMAAVAEAVPETIKAYFVLKSALGVVLWEKCVDCVLKSSCVLFNAPVFEHGMDKPVKFELMLLNETSEFRIASNAKSFMVYRDCQCNAKAEVGAKRPTLSKKRMASTACVFSQPKIMRQSSVSQSNPVIDPIDASSGSEPDAPCQKQNQLKAFESSSTRCTEAGNRSETPVDVSNDDLKAFESGVDWCGEKCGVSDKAFSESLTDSCQSEKAQSKSEYYTASPSLNQSPRDLCSTHAPGSSHQELINSYSQMSIKGEKCSHEEKTCGTGEYSQGHHQETPISDPVSLLMTPPAARECLDKLDRQNGAYMSPSVSPVITASSQCSNGRYPACSTGMQGDSISMEEHDLQGLSHAFNPSTQEDPRSWLKFSPLQLRKQVSPTAEPMDVIEMKSPSSSELHGSSLILHPAGRHSPYGNPPLLSEEPPGMTGDVDFDFKAEIQDHDEHLPSNSALPSESLGFLPTECWESKGFLPTECCEELQEKVPEIIQNDIMHKEFTL